MITGTKSVIIQANVTTNLPINCESDVLDNEEKVLWNSKVNQKEQNDTSTFSNYITRK